MLERIWTKNGRDWTQSKDNKKRKVNIYVVCRALVSTNFWTIHFVVRRCFRCISTCCKSALNSAVSTSFRFLTNLFHDNVNWDEQWERDWKEKNANDVKTPFEVDEPLQRSQWCKTGSFYFYTAILRLILAVRFIVLIDSRIKSSINRYHFRWFHLQSVHSVASW